ncbi:unnamed protein product [Didymodactylos carnosus]|uniref:EF-hand domain-containing protein n=1 Tax=Didymodactylos carnosus TaxID=1234261 RepID=A0A8S2EU91_9BILA|nr:unnamed protein product [Didymodactylos carnosus]CAF4047889.1 unnamed protein product [Didymodactylos carnosus]
MDHLTNEQKKQFVRKEFSKISKGNLTINHDEAVLLLERLDIDSNDNELSGLLHDADMNWDNSIDLDGIIFIVDHLSNRRNENSRVIYDEPDEVQLFNKVKQLLKKAKDLIDQGIVVSDEMFKQLQQQYGVPDHVLN